jgi:hypothetical protein|tara:strand:+ start:686 stop:922 length:237 start_codon:yes stop_codon:yes gene_type:complete
MTPRRAKRYINTSNDWILFATDGKEEKQNFRVIMSRNESWEILLNLAISDYPIRETLRNILTTADEHLKDNPINPEEE